MNNYNMHIPENPLFSDSETKELLKKAQAGNKVSRDQLIENNLRLVTSITNRFKNRGFEMDDLFQVGSIGLVKAIDGFDLSFDVKFSTYAVPKIIGEIKRFIRESSSSLRVSRSLKQLAVKAIELKDKLTSELGYTPTITELAIELNVEKEDLVAALDSVAPIQSLQQVIHEDEGNSILLEDQIAVTQENFSFYIKEVLNKLDIEEKRLVILRYFSEKSQSEVAQLLGISQAQVSRIEKRILAEMRNQM